MSDIAIANLPEEKNKGGRLLKHGTSADVDLAIQLYFLRIRPRR